MELKKITKEDLLREEESVNQKTKTYVNDNYFLTDYQKLEDGTTIVFRLLPQPSLSHYDYTSKIGVFYSMALKKYRALSDDMFVRFNNLKTSLFKEGKLKTKENPSGVNLKLSYKDLFYVYVYSLNDAPVNDIKLIALPSTTKAKEENSDQAGVKLKNTIKESFNGELLYPNVLDITKESNLIILSVKGTGISTRYNINVLPKQAAIPNDVDLSKIRVFDDMVRYATIEEYNTWVNSLQK